jgi:Zn-dependent protease
MYKQKMFVKIIKILKSLISVILFVFLFLYTIIFIHELGHYITALLYGLQVDEFVIGKGLNIFNFIIGQTQYRFHILPTGGFTNLTIFKGEELKFLATALMGGMTNIIIGLMILEVNKKFKVLNDDWKYNFAIYNLYIGIFNLIPLSIINNDGWKVWSLIKALI